MRVLAVAQRLSGAAGDRETRRRGHVETLGEPCRDRRVVSGGAGESRLRQPAPQRAVERPAGSVERAGDRVVIGGVGHRGDEGMVLRRRAQHRRTADIDVFHAGREIAAFGDRPFEGIEVDRDEIDGCEPVRRQRRAMVRIVAPREYPAMDRGVQRFDAPVEHFGKAGERFDMDDREPGVFEQARGAAGRKDLRAVARQRAREVDRAGLVRHREQGARHPDRRVSEP